MGDTGETTGEHEPENCFPLYPEELQKALIKRRLDGQSYREISADTGIEIAVIRKIYDDDTKMHTKIFLTRDPLPGHEFKIVPTSSYARLTAAAYQELQRVVNRCIEALLSSAQETTRELGVQLSKNSQDIERRFNEALNREGRNRDVGDDSRTPS